MLQSCLTLCDPGTIACLPGPSVHEIRWSGLPCSPPGDLPYPGIEPASLTSPSLAGGFFTTRIIWDVSCHGWLISPHKHTVLQARVHCARHSPTLTSLRSHVSLPLLLHTLPTCSDHLLSWTGAKGTAWSPSLQSFLPPVHFPHHFQSNFTFLFLSFRLDF